MDERAVGLPGDEGGAVADELEDVVDEHGLLGGDAELPRDAVDL